MSSLSSKQIKSRVPSEMMLVVAFILVFTTFALFDPRVTPLGNFSANHLQGSSALSSVVSNDETTFALDKQYWSANCSHGWKVNSTCDNILLRAQVCDNGADTAYCSQYDAYMQEIHKQLELRQYFPATKYDL